MVTRLRQRATVGQSLVPLQSICRSQLILFFSLGLAACSRRDPAPDPDPREGYARGDRVVVEQTAAQFFEGRVLAVTAGHLRVQAAGANESSNVVASDVYRLPPEPHELQARSLAICGQADVWLPCRVQNVTESRVRASSAAGVQFELPRERVLTPSALTELNLRRFFERNEAELSFTRSAERAGDPHPEPGWHPRAHERVLVKLGGEWFTGSVHELDDDAAIVILSSGRSVSAPFSTLAAEPPSSLVSELRRGDFVLLRPESPSQPWPRWQIRAVNDKEIKLSAADGSLRSASVRDVLLLKP